MFKKVLSVVPDHIKCCNLRIYLRHQGKVAEAKLTLQKACIFDWSTGNYFDLKFYKRAQEMLRGVEAKIMNYENSFIKCLKPTTGRSLQCPWSHTAPNQSKHEMPNSDLEMRRWPHSMQHLVCILTARTMITMPVLKNYTGEFINQNLMHNVIKMLTELGPFVYH